MKEFALSLLIWFLVDSEPAVLSAGNQSISGLNELGIPAIVNYSPDDYQANPMNWGAVRDHRGILYVANLNGILEFDGVSWRLINMPRGAWVLSLDKDSSGTIYAGLFGDFGYLAPDRKGQMQFVSLLSAVPAEARDFNEIWRTHCTKQGTYFRSKDKIFLWSDKKIKVFHAASFFSLSSVIADTLYVEDRATGMMRISADSLALIPESRRLRPLHFVAMLPYDGLRKLLCTSKGLFLFDGTRFSEFDTPANQFLQQNTLSSAVSLPGGIFVIATYQAGACVFDRQGNIRYILNKSSGLRNEDIKNMYVDTRGALWLCLNSGLTYIGLQEPYTYFTERQGLEGNVVSVIRHQNRIYAATSQSIYYLDNVNPQEQSNLSPLFSAQPLFKPVSGTPGQGFWLLSSGQWLLAATSGKGVCRIINDRTVQIDAEPAAAAFVLHRSERDSTIVYAGLRDGLEILKFKGKRWQPVGRITGIGEEIRTITEDIDGSLWLGTVFQGVLNVRLSPRDRDGWKGRIRRFDQRHGLPDGPVNVKKIDGRVIFATHQGHRRFDHTKAAFYPDSSISYDLADTSRSAAWIEQDRFGKIFVWPLNAMGKPELWTAEQTAGSWYRIEKERYRALTNFGLFHTTFTDADSVTWIGCSSGLIRFDPRIKQDLSEYFPTLLRQVSTVPGDSIIFAGLTNKTAARKILPYQNNALRFSYALPFLEDISGIRYQYILEGFDKNWSGWTAETRKDYTNLQHGNYEFKVRAKNLYGKLSREAVYRFEIQAPWYFRNWAFFAYFLTLLAGVYSGHRLMHSHLVKRELAEAKLREATLISRQNEELQKKNDQLEEILSQLHRAQNSLIESESRFRSVAESANDAVISANQSGQITFWNKKAELMFGYQKSEIAGRSLTLLMPERYRKAHLKGIERYYTTGQTRLMGKVAELQAVKKNGKEFPIELTLAAWETHDEKFVTGIIRDISLRKQKETALRETQTQLSQAEKMSTLGKLSAGMAHELNNPAASAQRGAAQLGKIFSKLQQLNIELGQIDLSDAQKEMLPDFIALARAHAGRKEEIEAAGRIDRELEVEKWLEERHIANAWEFAPSLVKLGMDSTRMQDLAGKFTPAQLNKIIEWLCDTHMIYHLLAELDQGTTKIAGIVQAFKSYTYMDKAPVQQVDLNKDLENTLLIMQSKLKREMTIRRDYAKDLPRIEAFGGELNQVWTNLIDNAIDAMGDKGELILKTRKADSWVIVEITDNGPGIPEQIQSRIFDPFFTTKPVGSGTGLGLNISHNIIVQKHHGQISFSSQPGRTRFTVRLPLRSVPGGSGRS